MEIENDELQELTEFRPSVGGEYESKDSRGHWWDITITAENADGSYCADVKDGHGTAWKKVHASNIIEKPPSTNNRSPLWQVLGWILFDVALCSLVYLWIFNMFAISDEVQNFIWYTVLGTSVLWRFRLCKKRDLPFSCVRMDIAPPLFGHDVDVYIIGTMHVSPGSVTDTKEVIGKVLPDIIMIELDRERLRDMKADLTNDCEMERFEHELQVNERAITSIHAEWNAGMDGPFGAYPTVTEGDNPFGDKRDSSLPSEHIYICRRSRTSIYTQTMWAQMRGARGVVIIDDASQPDMGLIVVGGVCLALKNFLQTRTLALPSIPTFLVKEEIGDGSLVEAFLKPNEIPRPYSFWKKLCRVCIMTISGIGILYGIIRQAGVKVGHEFLTADAEAEKLGRPCVCIDISVSNLGAKLKKEIMPTPMNLWHTILFLLALPRMIFYRLLFPFRDLDLVAAMLWAFARFKPRTWFAFVLAAVVTSFVVGFVLMIPGLFVRAASDHFAPGSDVGSIFESYFPFACELYLFPAIYRGLLDQRDEEMYRGIASQVRRRRSKQTFVAVVGAGHVNGIVARARTRGL